VRKRTSSWAAAASEREKRGSIQSVKLIVDASQVDSTQIMSGFMYNYWLGGGGEFIGLNNWCLDIAEQMVHAVRLLDQSIPEEAIQQNIFIN
jgi:hypothetical protein